MEPPSEDERWMSLALQLAEQGQGSVEPNPMVGCVLVRDGQLIGSGYHQRFGGPHAEVEAIRSVTDSDTHGATAYVTLEPCSHYGKTPPCCDALIKARIARVVVAMSDPFAKVDGEGIRRLRASGIEVVVGTLSVQAEELNAPYLKRLREHRPWVIAKWAMTADGRIATHEGQSQWISGEASRRQVHALRSRVDAILVGMGTVEADDPLLTARPVDNAGNPIAPKRVATRVIACRNRVPKVTHKLIHTADQTPTELYVRSSTPSDTLQALQAAGARVHRCESSDDNAFIGEMLAQLADREVTNLMIEGGPELLGSFLCESPRQCWIDELHVYVGAKLFGGSRAASPLGGLGFGELASAPRLELRSVDRFEHDLRLIYRTILH
ncbi:MAG: bifunctional diaminohydroxyphosphoribosylaminopyrimidine deaminase/5-amino-6-(5-phosphoribosylamino)uracil reductase RibD [Planctomycetota bacterium]